MVDEAAEAVMEVVAATVVELAVEKLEMMSRLMEPTSKEEMAVVVDEIGVVVAVTAVAEVVDVMGVVEVTEVVEVAVAADKIGVLRRSSTPMSI